MIRHRHSFQINTLPLFQQRYLTEDMLLFDIETTGLSPARNHIYCIGCGYLSGKEVVIELFFAENRMQEKPVLEAFFQLLPPHHTILTFNGTTFDIPFIRKRASIYELALPGDLPAYQSPDDKTTFPESTGEKSDDPLLSISSGISGLRNLLTSIDLYREATGMKSLLRLPSCRQKSIEQFLGCSREDKYDGGQLIKFYHQYTTHPDPEFLSLLLLHNLEDVKGMFDLIGILSYHQLRDGHFEITDIFEESSYYNIKFRTEYPFPQSIHRTDEYSSLLLNRDGGLIRFPLYHGFLRHFFSDCENYYYLPEEDYAVHKTVGTFVDSAHRRKATKKTCYTKKEYDYITAPSRYGDGYLRKEYQDKNIYLALPASLSDANSFVVKYFSDNLF